MGLESGSPRASCCVAELWGIISGETKGLNYNMQPKNRPILYFKLLLCKGFKNGYNVFVGSGITIRI